MTITKLLVSNRAEIASRVFRTCRALGIDTVAVHSDADAALPYVREADLAVRLPGTAPADTYLRIDRVLEAARRSGADAIHPGYGFLSENAAFARAVIAAGLTWVGPDPASIDAMGSKIAAKELMARAGVPVLANHTADSAAATDLPLLVKASAGGGGRGMRVVRSLADLPAEIAKAEAEALSAFGDGTVFVEAYVERGRHVEVQVVGAPDGVLVLGERDCSIQRRHQKVLEESPAPRLPEPTRAALHAAAKAAAEAIDYRGAGTAEFLYDDERDRFFFLEMNTRLQVEHPVTELVFGVDLVAMQIGVAEGRSCAELVAAATDPDLEADGHAIEVRLYAEDPALDWQPQSGVLTAFDLPAGNGIRVDSGFEAGNEVSTYYDAMIAKVISWAPTREQAARRLAGALSRARIHGVATNRDLLVRILRDEEFLDGRVSTAFLEERDAVRLPAPAPAHQALVAATLMLAADAGERRTVQRRIPVCWRNVASGVQTCRLLDDAGTEHSVAWLGGRDGVVVDGVEVLLATSTRVELVLDGVTSYWDGRIGAPGPTGEREIHLDGSLGSVRLRIPPRFVDPADVIASGSLLAPMPGTVVSVAVEVGAEVVAGQPVLVLEAMKMQHTVSAPTDGVVTRLSVSPGAQVAAGEVLVVVDPAAAEGEES